MSNEISLASLDKEQVLAVLYVACGSCTEFSGYNGKSMFQDSSHEVDRVALRNGATEAWPVVVTTVISLRRLLERDNLAFRDLVVQCRDPKSESSGNTKRILQQFSLIQPDEQIHESVRNVVLSAVKGDGLKILLASLFS